MATTKRTTKVIDGVHSGDTPPTPSGRPVIVTNRPFMTVDPMLTPSDLVEGDEKPSGEPQSKPSNSPTGPPKLSREAKKLAPVEEDSHQGGENLAKKSESEDNTSDGSSLSLKKTEEVQAAEASAAEPTSHHLGGIKIAPPKHDEATTTNGEDEVKETAEGISDEEKPENPEDNPETAKDIELERHIAAGTYFVPIGQVKRRRQKTLMLLLLTLLFAAIVFDILLDMGIMTFEHIPHTSFFGE